NTNIKFEKQKSIIINKNKNIIFAPSWKTNSKIMYYIKISFSLFWLFYYLMIHVKKDEKIIAYHVQWISLPIRAAKFFKKFKLILEIEEIYGEVWENTKLMNSWE